MADYVRWHPIGEWKNLPDLTTPASAEFLEHIETGVFDAQRRADDAYALGVSGVTDGDKGEVTVAGGVWSVEALHSGSTHAAVQSAAEGVAALDATAKADAAQSDAEATAAGALAGHAADTTNQHGVADFATLYRAGGTNVALTDGGTNADTATDAATNLGVDILGAAARVGSPTAHPALANFHRAWANKGTAAIKALWIGDSEVEFGFINRALSTLMSDLINPPNRQQTGHNAQGSVYPGDFVYGVGAAIPEWTSTTGLVPGDVVVRGMAGQAIAMANLDDLTSIAMTFEKVTFCWEAPLSGAGATYDFYLDGALTAPNTGISAAARGTHTITTTPGSHTVGIVSHGVTLFDRVDLVYGNDASGWRTWSAAHGGYSTANFNSVPDLDEWITLIDPDIIFFATGVNDYQLGDEDGNLWSDRMVTLMTTARSANADASHVLILPQAMSGFTRWENYRKYAVQLCLDRPDVFLIDLTNTIPSLAGETPAVADSKGITVDGLHYSLLGRRIVAQAIRTEMLAGGVRELIPSNLTLSRLYHGPSGGGQYNVDEDFDRFSAAPATSTHPAGSAMLVDFLGGGSPGAATQSEAADSVRGCLDLATGIATTGWARAALGSLTFDDTKNYFLQWRIKESALSDGTNTYLVRLGLMNGADPTVAPTNGIYVEGLSTGTWHAISKDSGGGTDDTNSAIAQSTNFQSICILYYGGLGTAYFYIAGNNVATHTNAANRPGATALFPEAYILKSAGTSSRSLKIDLVQMSLFDNRGNLFQMP